jgi:RND superfamily putative drug exporter
MLKRISGFAAGRRSKWVVLGIWLLAAFAISPLQSKLQEATKNEPEAFLPRTSEATRVTQLLKHRFPEGRDVPAVLVFASDDGRPLTGAQRARIADQVAAATRSGVLKDARPPVGGALRDRRLDAEAIRLGLLSSDRSTAVVLIPMNPEDSEALQQNVDRIRDRIEAGRPAAENGGIEAHVTGPAGLSVDAIEVFNSIDGTLLLATVTLVLVLLLIVYRSPLVALIPLIVVGIAYTIAAGILYEMIHATGFDVNGQTTGILIVLMFGAGTDYCLLIVSRFREELRTNEDKHVAMAKATERTAPAILSAGGTVFAAMLVLLLADLRSTQNLGPALAIGVAVTLLAGLTLLPALLAIFGRKSFWPRVPAAGSEPVKPAGVWRRIGHLVHDRPFLVMMLSIAFLVLGALGNLTDTEKLSFGSGFRKTTDSSQGSKLLERKLPPGEVGTANVIVSPAAAKPVSRALAGAPNVAAVRVQSRSTDGKLVRLAVVFDEDPYSDAAAGRVPGLRETANRAAQGAPPVSAGRAALVGGVAAENHDSYVTMKDDAELIVPAILLLVFLILALLLRALVAPLYLVATVVLSFAFALGASTLIFTQLLGQPQIEPWLPTISFLFLVALGVDYNIFLISRVREEDAKLGIREGVIAALEKTGGVITSAGLILAGTFMTLSILPLDSLLQIGVTVALGLLVDTFLVRVFLVPSIAFQLGELNWWPSRRKRPAGNESGT